MLITATGKAEAGYTLLEILGVILLIGLILTLAQPQISRVEEKNRMRYVGELLQTDLQRVQAEAKAGNTVKFKFTANGYCFSLDEAVIKRDYRVNGVAFSMENNEPELNFTPEGPAPVATINWTGAHYQGALALTPDGAVSWGYHVK
jgi:type II secretory pathway pseudopilin PulG